MKEGKESRPDKSAAEKSSGKPPHSIGRRKSERGKVDEVVAENGSSATAATSISQLLRSPKDAAVAFAARTFVNQKLKGIGELTDLRVDTKTKSMRLRLELRGESEPLEIHVAKYSLKQKGDETRLIVKEATASREWVAVALRDFVVGQSFPIASKAGIFVKLLT